MDDSALTEAERRFVRSLQARGVRHLVVGMSAALLQGARGATEDIDVWFAEPADPGIAAAARESELGDRIDVVTHMHGLEPFDAEAARAMHVRVAPDLELPLLPLDRILASKRATGRRRDLAQIPALETAIAVLAETDDG